MFGSLKKNDASRAICAYIRLGAQDFSETKIPFRRIFRRNEMLFIECSLRGEGRQIFVETRVLPLPPSELS